MGTTPFGVGDRVICLILGRDIVSSGIGKFDRKVILEIISLYADGLLVFIPKGIRLDDCIDITKANADKFGVAKRFIGSRCFYITEHKVVSIYSRMDGMCCKRCQDFYPMASPNQEDGTMLCWLCRTYKYR